jgi:DsbC/DsbD-like thiol-disulfide interchange protein
MRMLRLSSLVLALLCASPAAFADASAPVAAGEARVRLLAGKNDTNSAPVLAGGVEIVLTPGWKTYWRYPGDAGVPPRFDWTGSENVARVEVFYPAPKRITDGSGSLSIGYEARVIFPLRIHPVDPAKPVQIRLKLDFATCHTLCIPAEASLTLAVATSVAAEPALAGAHANVPRKAGTGGDRSPSIVSAQLERGVDGKPPRVIVLVKSGHPASLDLFAEGPDERWTLALPERLPPRDGHAAFAVPLEGALFGKAEIPPRLRLTVVGADGATETELPLD